MPKYTLTEAVKAALWSTAATRDTIVVEPGVYDIVIAPTITDGIGEISAILSPESGSRGAFLVIVSTHWGLTPIGKAIHERGFYESPEGGQEFLNQLVPR